MNTSLLVDNCDPVNNKKHDTNRVSILVFDTIINPENLKLDLARECMSKLNKLKKDKIYNVTLSTYNLNGIDHNRIKRIMLNDEKMNDVLMIMYRLLCSSRITKRITSCTKSTQKIKDTNKNEIKLAPAIFPSNTYCIDAKILTQLIDIKKTNKCKLSLKLYIKN